MFKIAIEPHQEAYKFFLKEGMTQQSDFGNHTALYTIDLSTVLNYYIKMRPITYNGFNNKEHAYNLNVIWSSSKCFESLRIFEASCHIHSLFKVLKKP